jgi:hypothetical protein
MMNFLKKVFCEILLQNGKEEALLLGSTREIIDWMASILDKNTKHYLCASFPCGPDATAKIRKKAGKEGAYRTICSEITFF